MRYCWLLLSLENCCKQSYPQVQVKILILEKLRTVNGIFLIY
ncbi:hypothetical protein AC45_0122 [Escherichia coli 2-210-07_S3_C3]|nr:hypothetical protein EC3431_2406 [Escherichia coli 3431]KDX08230.1 hypothetical protein AC45_5884 [Escherichia coli 2-210-07_S3_C3]KDX22196.1 hypothetical protein AC45_0122 [Escherichia coli 2-210-07_S3_C3]